MRDNLSEDMEDSHKIVHDQVLELLEALPSKEEVISHPDQIDYEMIIARISQAHQHLVQLLALVQKD